jgi:hypothetical protein
VTLINAWWQRDPSGGQEADREIYVHCEGCLPPRQIVGTAAFLSAMKWEFDGFEAGPHFCPFCSARRMDGSPERRTAPESSPALPNLLIIGAMKCGTTSLHRYLAMHPEVFMTDFKELNYFLHPESLERLETYASFFDRNSAVRGESSPAYALYPPAPGVPERIRAAIPEVKLIYLVRDPIKRLTSHWIHERASGAEPRSFEEVVLRYMDDPYNRYIAAGMYATQLEQYTSHFSPDQFLIIDQADLLKSRQETLRRVFGFLGVDESFVSPGFNTRYNPGETKRRPTRIGRLLYHSRLAERVRRIPDGPRQVLFRPAKRATSRKLPAPAIDEGARRRLDDLYRDDVDRLRELTGQSFAGWSL